MAPVFRKRYTANYVGDAEASWPSRYLLLVIIVAVGESVVARTVVVRRHLFAITVAITISSVRAHILVTQSTAVTNFYSSVTPRKSHRAVDRCNRLEYRPIPRPNYTNNGLGRGGTNGNMTSRRQTHSRSVKSRTGQLADWSTRRNV